MLAAKRSIPPPHHAPKSDASIFGQHPSSAVRALQPPTALAAAEADQPQTTAAAASIGASRSVGIAQMLANKASRHAAALALYSAAKDAARSCAETDCATAAHWLAQRLADSGGAIDRQMSLLDESGVMQLSAPEFERVWLDVAAQSLVRTACLQQLESELAAVEAARQEDVEVALRDLGAALEEAAHADAGQVQRLLEEEALELDQALLADRLVEGSG